MDNCKHEHTKEIARYTCDCGLSGEITWIRTRCLDCGRIVMDRLVDQPDDPTPDPPTETPKKRRKGKK